MEGMNIIRKKTWVIVDVEIVKGHNQPIGLVFKEVRKYKHDSEKVLVHPNSQNLRKKL